MGESMEEWISEETDHCYYCERPRYGNGVYDYWDLPETGKTRIWICRECNDEHNQAGDK